MPNKLHSTKYLNCLDNFNIYYLYFFYSFNAVIYLKTLLWFYRNPSVSPHADYESNTIRR